MSDTQHGPNVECHLDVVVVASFSDTARGGKEVVCNIDVETIPTSIRFNLSRLITAMKHRTELVKEPNCVGRATQLTPRETITRT